MATVDGVLNNAIVVNTLDGLTTFTTSGGVVDPSLYVKYNNNTSDTDLGSYNIKTTHVATTSADLVNLQVLTDSNTYILNLIGSNYLNKVTTTPQTVTGAVTLNGDTLTINSNTTVNGATFFTQDVRMNQLDLTTADQTLGWMGTVSGSVSGGPFDLTWYNQQTANQIIFRDTGKIEATGATLSGNLTMSGTARVTQSYNALTSDTTTLVNRQTLDAAIAGLGAGILNLNNTWTGSNTWLSNAFYVTSQPLGISFSGWTLVTGQSISLGPGNTSITVTSPVGSKANQIKSATATVTPYQVYSFTLTYSTSSFPFTASILDGNGTTLYTSTVSNGSGTLTSSFTMTNSSIIQLYSNLNTNGASITWSAFTITTNTVGANTDLYMGGNNSVLTKYITNQTPIGAGVSPYNNRPYSASMAGILYNNTDTTAGYGDAIQLNFGQDTSRGNSNMLVLGKNSIKARIYQGTFGSSSAYSTYRDLVFQGDSFDATGTLTVAQDQAYANRATNPFSYQFMVKSATNGQRLYLGTYYTAGSGACSAIQSSDFYSSVDHGSFILLNPLGGSIGIGTSSVPGTKLEVYTATSNYGMTHTDGTIIVGSYVGGASNSGWYGTKSNHNLNFFTNDGGATMTCKVGGNVGIGTTNPSAPLEVVGNFKASGNVAICGNTSTDSYIECARSGTLLSIQGRTFEAVAQGLNINPNGGNVGIGTTNPYTRVHTVGNSSGKVASLISNVYGAVGSSACLQFGIWSGAGSGTGVNVPSAEIAAVNQNTSNANTDLVFSVFTGAATSPNYTLIERMRINAGGHTAIGAATNGGLASLSVCGGNVSATYLNPTVWPTDTNGVIIYNTTSLTNTNSGLMLAFGNANGYVTSLAPGISWQNLYLQGAVTYAYYFGALASTLTNTGWVNVSDEREKEDIQDLKTSSSLKRVLALKPKNYLRKYYDDGKTPVPEEIKQKRCVGFLAQQVMESNPHCVCDWENEQVEKTEEDDGKRFALSYNDYVVHLVGAVQEQQKMIESQQEIIKTLTDRSLVLEEHARTLEDAFNTYRTTTDSKIEKLASLIASLVNK
jgi:hypothetical protein